MLKAKYAECKDELADLEEVMTYVALCLGKDDSITNNFIKQVNEKKQSVCSRARYSITVFQSETTAVLWWSVCGESHTQGS